MHTYIHTYVFAHIYIHIYLHKYLHAYIHYLHRFHISDEQTCPCGDGDQTTDHIIYDCPRLKEERNKLRAAVNKTENWPISKGNY
jgi:hypothetical protein